VVTRHRAFIRRGGDRSQGLVGLARATGHWQTVLSDDVYFSLVPRVSSFGHPGT